ncbi:MAG: hypothetical protein LC723_06750 [Actinobacteria bacterium]|nr:hypothetical protein [Actinomycetota bacterium]
MTNRTKVWLGIASFWPPVYFVCFLIVWGLFMMTILRSVSAGRPPSFTQFPPSTGITAFLAIFVVHVVTLLGAMALAIFYIIDMYRNDRVNDEMKVVWLVLLILLSLFTLPVYWYLHVKGSPETS